MAAAVTREELIAAATVLHDEECSCDRKYLMSCPNMASAILRSGPSAVKGREAKAATFAVGDRVRIASRNHPWHGSTGTISAPFSSPSAPDLKWTVSLDAAWVEAAVSGSDIRSAG